MGGLKRLDWIQRLQIWLFPVLVATVIVATGHFTVLRAAPTSQEILDYLDAGNSLVVGSELVNDFYQIYFSINGEKVYITNSNRHASGPITSAEYIVYVAAVDGYPQIYQYNSLTGSTIQVSSYSTNTQPAMYLNWVVWQHWVDEKWQIEFYDGVTTAQISDPIKGSAARPIIRNDEIRYTQELAGTFNIKQYIPSDNSTINLISGPETVAGVPRF